MTAKILDGKAYAKHKMAELKIIYGSNSPAVPELAIIKATDDDASDVYVRNKVRAAVDCGINSHVYEFDQSATVENIIELIDVLNKTDSINGIIVQLPLRDDIMCYERDILDRIDPDKDVDGLSTQSIAGLDVVLDTFAPCTPAGIVKMLEDFHIPIARKHAVIVGRSDLVGKPLAKILLNYDATVTICHSMTQDLAKITRQADILVSATGCPKLITADMVKPGAVVIDVGINRDKDGKLCGDVDFEAVKEVAGWITPVPGGVGPVTVMSLMRHVFIAQFDQGCKRNAKH